VSSEGLRGAETDARLEAARRIQQLARVAALSG